MKMYIDASACKSGLLTGGISYRGSGDRKTVSYLFENGSSLLGETLILREALILIEERRLFNVSICTDCDTLFNNLRDGLRKEEYPLNDIFPRIIRLYKTGALNRIILIPRKENLAHNISKGRLQKERRECVWYM